MPSADGIHIEHTKSGQMAISHSELVSRYSENYGFADDAGITAEMVLKHWALEQRLTRELLASTPESRWAVFERCYTELYKKVEWLGRLTAIGQAPPEQRYATWAVELGQHRQEIYEVGSGKGGLITYLAELGHQCTGTDVSRERGQKQERTELDNLRWAPTDGVHLDRFEAPESYDFVISNQLIEHLHPGDLEEHFASASRILKPGGRYLLSTPHRHGGPFDVSAVLKYESSQGMHLKEYTFRELVGLAKRNGFRSVRPATPTRFRKLLVTVGLSGERQTRLVGGFYLRWLLLTEFLMKGIPSQRLRRATCHRLKKLWVFSDNIFLSAHK